MERRDFLKIAGVAGVSLMVPGSRRGVLAEGPAKKYEGPYFLCIHAGGGWDPTMVCDPKGDPVNRQFKAGEWGTAGALKFAPIVYTDNNGQELYSNERFFMKHKDRLLVINGVDTTTGNHDTGTRVTWSGKMDEGFPSFAALVAGAKTPGNPLAFISSGGYEQTGGVTSLTRLGGVDAVTRIAYTNRIDPAKADYLFHTQPTMERVLRVQRERLDDLRLRQGLPQLQRTMSSLYVSRSGDSELSLLAQQLPSNRQLDEARNPLLRQALVAIAGFKAGLAVSANLSIGGFDTHGDHDRSQGNAVWTLLAGLDGIFDELVRVQLDSKVVVVVGSDFGRTPAYNAQNGKDHWNITSMMIAGPGVPGGRVVGGTDDAFKARTFDTSLRDSAGGQRIRPEHIHKALRKLAGIEGSEVARLHPVAGDDLPFFAG